MGGGKQNNVERQSLRDDNPNPNDNLCLNCYWYI